MNSTIREITATDRIIWVTFVPALSGSAVARLISASEDIFWDHELQRIAPLELDSPHDWHIGPLGTCHYASPLGSIAYDESAFRSQASFRRRLAKDAAVAARAAKHLDSGQKFVQTTHLPDTLIADVFPNCAIVAITDNSLLDFSLRAYHEKFNVNFWPMSLQRLLWQGKPLDEAVAHVDEPVSLHQGNPLTGLQHLTGKIDPCPQDVRILSMRIYHDMRKQMALHTQVTSTIAADRATLFSPLQGEGEYRRLCDRLGIRPAACVCERFIMPYNSRQWHRRPFQDSVS